MSSYGLTFVHGINNGPKARFSLDYELKNLLSKYNALDQFYFEPHNKYNVDAATWESVGDFVLDLANLKKPEWRESVITSVGTQIQSMQDQLHSQAWSNAKPLHVIVMHSMGQPLGISAVAELTKAKKMKVPTVIVSVGGPLGNRNPMYKSYLQWCTKRISWYNPKDSLAVKSWVDIYNTDDPICCEPEIGIFGRVGYAPCRGVTKSVQFDWPGKPSITNPLSEHSSYFDDKMLFETITSIVSSHKKDTMSPT